MRWLRDNRGQALMETALVITLVVLLLMGIFDLGRAVYIYSDLCQSAREVARYASTMDPRDPTAAENKVTDYSTLGLDPRRDATVVFTTTHPLSVNVTLSYQYVPLSPIIAALVGDAGFTVVAKSAMLVE